jgi:hypothetical protein
LCAHCQSLYLFKHLILRTTQRWNCYHHSHRKGSGRRRNFTQLMRSHNLSSGCWLVLESALLNVSKPEIPTAHQHGDMGLSLFSVFRRAPGRSQHHMASYRPSAVSSHDFGSVTCLSASGLPAQNEKRRKRL